MPSNQDEIRNGLSGEERLIERYFRPLATAPNAFVTSSTTGGAMSTVCTRSCR